MSEIVVNSLVDPELAKVLPGLRAAEDAGTLRSALKAYPGYVVASNDDLGLQMVELAEGDKPVAVLLRRWTLKAVRA